MIVLRTRGWTGPREVDGNRVEGSWRSHQVPLSEAHTNPEHRAQLEHGCAAIGPRNFSTTTARCSRSTRAGAHRQRRMSANPHANGGLLLQDLDLPAFPDYAVAVDKPATQTAEATKVLGTFLRDVIVRNPDRFRLMGPDETASNRLSAAFEATDKTWRRNRARRRPSRAGRPRDGGMPGHLCQGWLGLLTDRPARLVQLLRGVRAHRRFDGPRNGCPAGRELPGGDRSPR